MPSGVFGVADGDPAVEALAGRLRRLIPEESTVDPDEQARAVARDVVGRRRGRACPLPDLASDLLGAARRGRGEAERRAS